MKRRCFESSYDQIQLIFFNAHLCALNPGLTALGGQAIFGMVVACPKQQSLPWNAIIFALSTAVVSTGVLAWAATPMHIIFALSLQGLG